MQEAIDSLNNLLKGKLEPVIWQGGLEGSAREMLGEKIKILPSSLLSLETGSSALTKGLNKIKELELAIEKDALDKILKMNITGLPGLEAIVKANIMQHHGGINHSQMLLIFDRACQDFEKGDVDVALGIFLALLFVNPFIAPLWYCMAKAYEVKKDLPKSLFCYAMCDLLKRGNLPTALDATECLIAAGKKDLAQNLLREIEIDLHAGTFATTFYDRAVKLKEALSFITA